jgi:hypothetical protein
MFDDAVPATADALPSEQVNLNPSHNLAQRQAAMRARADEHNAPGVDLNMRPYSVSDLMVLHNASRRTIIRWYETEDGVEDWSKLNPPDRRRCTGQRYRTLKVPRYVYLRVKHRLTRR